MMKKTVQGLMALAVLLFSTGAAQAIDIFKNAQADVFVLGGASTLVDPQNFQTPSALYHSRLEMGLKYTLGVEVPYGKLLHIEMAFSGGPNNLNVADINTFNPRKQVDYPVRFYSGSIAGVVHAPFTFLHVRPYAEGGVEYDRYSPTQAAITTATNQGFASVSTATMNHNDKFGMNVGVGLDRKIMKRVTFRIDLRDHITSSPAFGIPPRPTASSNAIFPVSGRANNIEYTAGFVLHLGKL